MPDEHSEKMIRLLEEIRDLTKDRYDKLESYWQTTRQQYEDALRRQKEAHERSLTHRRRFLWTLTPLLLLAIGFVAYLAFWVIPQSERRQMERQLEEMRMMQSNYWMPPR